jgi:hypothetical protein
MKSPETGFECGFLSPLVFTWPDIEPVSMSRVRTRFFTPLGFYLAGSKAGFREPGLELGIKNGLVIRFMKTRFNPGQVKTQGGKTRFQIGLGRVLLWAELKCMWLRCAEGQFGEFSKGGTR